jgi:hypothetical protein
MLPREHGAYFQLAIPLVAAGFSHRPGIAGAAIMVASCLAFLAHEPLLILAGARGARPRAIEGGRARVRFAWLATGALVLGALGLVLAPVPVFFVAAPAAVASAVVIVTVARHIEHTLAGELIAAIALTGASSVVLAASGTAVGEALRWWLGWAIGFSATVIAVHRVIARHRRPATAIDRFLAIGLLAGSALLLATASRCSPSALAAPLVVLATGIVAVPPRATRLRTVGIAIVVMAAVSAVLGVVFAWSSAT